MMSHFRRSALVLSILVVAALPAVAFGGTTKIINGTAVQPDRKTQMWSHLVSVGGAGKAVDSHYCGGSLIAPTLVLTAAHCVADYGEGAAAKVVLYSEPRTVFILAGATALSSEKQGQRRRVVDHFVHPRWNPKTSAHDIAVLRLGTPVTLNDQVRLGAVVTPEQDSWWGAGGGFEPSPERGPWAAGWGNTKPRETGQFFPDVSREVLMRVIADEQCAQDGAPNLGDYDGGVNLATHVCIGIPDSDTSAANGTTSFDTCQGDSGGPVMAGDGAGAWSIFALVSYGDQCGGDFYGAYTRLASYRTWIASIDPLRNGPGGIAPVAKIRVVSRGYASSLIRWTPVPGAKGYAVYVDYGEDGMRRLGFTKAPRANVRFLEYGFPYDAYVTARNANGDESPMRRVVVRAGS